MTAMFRVARNPDPASRLPYLVRLPLGGGLVLNAREPWPRAARVFCAQDETLWDDSAAVVDQSEVLLCRRRGAAIDLVLDRPQLSRSQFIFTRARGRPAVWWQTQKTVQAANPGARIPRGRSTGLPGSLSHAARTRRFAGGHARASGSALPSCSHCFRRVTAVRGGVDLPILRRRTFRWQQRRAGHR